MSTEYLQYMETLYRIQKFREENGKEDAYSVISEYHPKFYTTATTYAKADELAKSLIADFRKLDYQQAKIFLLAIDYIRKNHIYSETDVYESKQVEKTAVQLVADICNIVGYEPVVPEKITGRINYFTGRYEELDKSEKKVEIKMKDSKG